MVDWLPVVGTLAGAIVAGGIAVILHIASNRNSIILLKLQLDEERARWAVEQELDSIRNFYGTIEHLIDAAEGLRLQQSWSIRDDPKIPSWVPSPNGAREAIHSALQSAYSETPLLSVDVQSAFRQSLDQYRLWYLAETSGEGIENLVQLENDLNTLKTSLGERYRKVFDSRRIGSDLTRAHETESARSEP